MQDFVIVTGANGAIGAEIAQEALRCGLSVLAVDKTFIGADQHLQIKSEPSIYRQNFDISLLSEPDGQEALLSVVGQFSSSRFRLVGLVNNAAVQVVKPHFQLTSKEWSEIFLVNAIAPALLVQLVAPNLRSSEGAVVNIGSVHDYVTKPGFSAYAASKGALTAITRGIALDEGSALRIYNLAPGAVDTPMLRAGFKSESGLGDLARHQPLGRVAQAREIAALVIELVLRGAPLLSGSTLRVDGAVHARLHDPE